MLKHCIIKLEGVHLLEFLDFREILLHLRCPKNIVKYLNKARISDNIITRYRYERAYEDKGCNLHERLSGLSFRRHLHLLSNHVDPASLRVPSDPDCLEGLAHP